MVLYNRPTGTWFTVWLDAAAGGQGLGGFKSTTPSDPSPTSWTHFVVHSNSSDDRESGWADNNPASPFYGRMYVSWNDFNVGGGALKVRYSTDNGATWNNERQITTGVPFVRNVQITGDLTTGEVYLTGMDEGGGGFPHNNINKIYRSTDGGNTWTNTYSGPLSRDLGGVSRVISPVCITVPLTGATKAGASLRRSTMSCTMSTTRGTRATAMRPTCFTFARRIVA